MSHAPAIAAAVLLLLAPAIAQRGEGGRRQPEPPKLAHFTFAAASLVSTKVRQGEAGYYVYLPKDHGADADKDRVYPWILWLPGFGGPDEFVRRGGSEALDRMRGEGKLPDCALVVFRAPGRRGRTTYMNGEAGGDIEDLIVGDLLTHVQKTHRLSAERKHRAIMGESAGGFGALKIALRHPEVFGAVAVHSAAILPADPAELAGMSESVVQRQLRGGLQQEFGDPIDKAKWAAHMPLALVASRKPAELGGLQVFFDAGTQDDYGFFEPNVQFDAALTANGHAHWFRRVEEGGHAWSCPTMQERVAVALQFAGAAIAGKDAAATVRAALAAATQSSNAAKEQAREKEKEQQESEPGK